MKISRTIFLTALIFIFNLYLAAFSYAVQSENERVAKLVEGAKKEKKLLWYTTVIIYYDMTNFYILL